MGWKEKRVRGERRGGRECKEMENEEEREDDGDKEVLDGGVGGWLCLSLHCEKDLIFSLFVKMKLMIIGM